MGFSYALNSSNEQDRAVAAVRLAIGDTSPEEGVRADGCNLSDEEILHFLERAGGNQDSAVLAIADMLAMSWARAVDVTVGPRKESLSQAAERWQKMADAMRGRGVTTTGASGAASFAFVPRRIEECGEYTLPPDCDADPWR